MHPGYAPLGRELPQMGDLVKVFRTMTPPAWLHPTPMPCTSPLHPQSRCLEDYQNSWSHGSGCMPRDRDPQRTLTRHLSSPLPRAHHAPPCSRVFTQAVSPVWNVLSPACHLHHSFPSFSTQLEPLYVWKDFPDSLPTIPYLGQIPLLHYVHFLRGTHPSLEL